MQELSSRPAFPTVCIRLARPQDAPALTAFAARIFRETFESQNDPADMAAYLADAFSLERQAAEIADPSAIVLLATVEHSDHGRADAAGRGPDEDPAADAPIPANDDDAAAAIDATDATDATSVVVAGYAHLTPGEAPPAVRGADPFELKRFYVGSAWQGSGLAQRLMRAAHDAAAARGAKTLWLGVWEHNPRAIAFYRKAGFVEVGAHAFLLGRDLQTDILMTRPIGPVDAADPVAPVAPA